MYVMTIDQQGSRTAPDAVPGLLDALADIATVRDFERTIGDEIQGVLDDAEQVTLAVRIMAMQAGWHIGIGIGPVGEPLPPSTVEGRGEAFYAARRAVEAAKNAPAHLVVDTGSEGAGGDGGYLAEAALRLMVRTIEAIRTQSRRYIGYRLDHPESTQTDIAEHFDVSQQAVSRVLSLGSVEIIAGGQALSSIQLSQADAQAAGERSRGSRAAPHASQSGDAHVV